MCFCWRLQVIHYCLNTQGLIAHSKICWESKRRWPACELLISMSLPFRCQSSGTSLVTIPTQRLSVMALWKHLQIISVSWNNLSLNSFKANWCFLSISLIYFWKQFPLYHLYFTHFQCEDDSFVNTQENHCKLCFYNVIC